MILTLIWETEQSGNAHAAFFYSLPSKWCCQYDKKVSSDLEFSIKLRGETFVSKWTNTFGFFPSPPLQLFAVKEKAMLRKKGVHGESIIPGDFESFAWGKCDFAKACLEKSWRLFGYFYSLPPPLLLLRPLLPSSSSPLHLCPSLYYSEEDSSHRWNTPVHTGITEASQFTSNPMCAPARVSDSLRTGARAMEWFSLTDRFLSYSTWNHIPPTPTCPSHLLAAAFALMEAVAQGHKFIRWNGQLASTGRKLF